MRTSSMRLRLSALVSWAFLFALGCPNPTGPVATPTLDPSAGTYQTDQNVALSCDTSGATIHYTTDGTTPTTSSATYSSPIP